MDPTFYGAITLTAAMGYFGLAWAHRRSVGAASEPLMSRKIGQAALLLVIALHGLSLMPNWFAKEGLHFGFATSISWTLWLAVLLLWIESWFQRLPPITQGVFLVAAIAAALPLLFPGRALTATLDATFRIHMLLAMLAYSTFTLAAASAVLMLAMEKALHQTRRINIDQTGWWQGLPPLLGLDQMLVHMVFAGFLLITLTLLSGMAVGLELGLGLLRFDHKTVFTIASWTMSLTLLIGHKWWGWRGRVAARWTLAGFAALLMAYVGTRFVLEVLLNRGA
ncbi:MAG: hypothetical protein FGM18_02715 [Burkholderiaceae bacterium]|nr:hypothetical protein [Burkholderiaceae bacterium]